MQRPRGPPASIYHYSQSLQEGYEETKKTNN
jgi:hypothetical protein